AEGVLVVLARVARVVVLLVVELGEMDDVGEGGVGVGWKVEEVEMGVIGEVGWMVDREDNEVLATGREEWEVG
ncbi:hypothetical protein, partial [Corynebacterium glyciniphilum]|uniref:hypothetical protein n=1 Tax=Corynebacterium glyciniphilum TaxID=1404244 RepID=UPI001642CA27